MPSSWRVVKLEEVANEVTVGYVGSMATEYISSGVPFLRSKNIDPLTINAGDLKFISAKFHEKISKSRLSPGDVVIVRTGKPGTCAVVPEWLADANCSDLVIVRCGPEINNRFLAYYVNTSAAAHVSAHLVGAVQQHFNVGAAKCMEILLPSLTEQIHIVHILGTLDDKIELNRQMNTTLESIAQALFKSWFVDFDPVIDNALAAGNPIPEPLQARAEVRQALGDKRKPLPEAIRQQFPDQFVFTEEMGWVPEGWSAITFGERMTPSKGKNITKKTVVEGSVPVVAGGLSPAYYHNESNVLAPSVTVSASGANAGFVRLYDQDIWASDCSYVNATHTEFVYSTYLFLKSKQYEISLMQQGAAQPHVYPRDLMRLPLIDPPPSLWKTIEDYLKPTFGRIRGNVRSNEALSGIRDTLLPKLLSGELRIPDAENLIAETV